MRMYNINCVGVGRCVCCPFDLGLNNLSALDFPRKFNPRRMFPFKEKLRKERHLVCCTSSKATVVVVNSVVMNVIIIIVVVVR